MKTVLKIGEYKSKRNMPVLDSSREEYVINKSIKYLTDKTLKNYLKEFLINLIEISKRLQKRK